MAPKKKAKKKTAKRGTTLRPPKELWTRIEAFQKKHKCNATDIWVVAMEMFLDNWAHVPIHAVKMMRDLEAASKRPLAEIMKEISATYGPDYLKGNKK